MPRKLRKLSITFAKKPRISKTNSIKKVEKDPATSQESKHEKTLNEEIILNIFKSQKVFSKTSEPVSQRNMNQNSCLKVFAWVESTLNSTPLKASFKNSIYHRFIAAHKIIMNSLDQRNIIFDNLSLKILNVTLFLLVYKMEGFITDKLTIRAMIHSFLRTIDEEEKEIEKDILQTEINLLLLVDYNIEQFNNNTYTIAHILYNLIKEKFCVFKKKQMSILDFLPIVIRKIDISNESFLTNMSFLDKGLIALFTTIVKLNNNSLDKTIIMYMRYFIQDLKISTMSLVDFIRYSRYYSKKL